MSSSRFGYDVPRGPLAVNLVRHGNAPWVRDGVTVDDPALGQRGTGQCKALAQELSGKKFDLVLTSPVKRALETIAVAGDGLATPKVQDWLAEIRYPTWQGQPPEVAARALAGARVLPAHERWNAFEDSGEGIRSFTDRVRSGLRHFLSGIQVCPTVESGSVLWEMDSVEHEILVVAHAGSISTAISMLLGMEPTPWEWERFQIGHCSITRLITIPIGHKYVFCIERLGYMEFIPEHLRSW
jgi:probable phosphoglycerate mutase